MDNQNPLPPPQKKPLRYVLVPLPNDWVEQLDTFSAFYCKARLTFIRDFIHTGINELIKSYAGKEHELAEMKKLFDEMERKTVAIEAKKQSSKSKWEDSY